MPNLIFLDLETTGFDPKNDKIIEFAAVRVDENFKELGAMDFLVNPEKDIPAIVCQVTKILQKDVENEKAFEARIEEVKAFIGDDIIIGHNIGFDISFLKEYGIATENKSLDTCDLATILLPSQKSYALEVLSDVFEIEHKYKHRALGDVLANIDLMKVLVDHLQNFPESFWGKLESYKEKIAGEVVPFLWSRHPGEGRDPEEGRGGKDNKESVRLDSRFHGDDNNIFTPNLTSLDEVPENTLIQAENMQEVENHFYHVLQEGGLVSVSRDYLNHFAQRFSEIEGLQVFHPQSFFADEEKVQKFLAKNSFDEKESCVLLKILRNQSGVRNADQYSLTEETLNIHWGDFTIWKTEIARTDTGTQDIDLTTPTLIAHDAFVKGEVAIPNDKKTLVFDLKENDLDDITKQLLSEKRAMESIENEQVKKMLEDIFQDIKNWMMSDEEELGIYGKQKTVSLNDLYSEAFLFIKQKLEKFFQNFSEYKEQFSLFESFFSNEKNLIRFISMNGAQELYLNVFPADYKENLQRLPQKASFISLSIIAGDSADYVQTFLGLESKSVEVSPFNQPIDIFLPEDQFPGPKNPNYINAVKEKLESIFQKYLDEKVLVMCASKSQVEQLFLYFAVEHEIGTERQTVASGFSGGKSKMMHVLKKHENAIFFCQPDILDSLILEGVGFKKMVVVKFPFDPPTPVVKQRQLSFSNGFNDYVLPKSVLKLQRSIRIVEPNELYLLDKSIQLPWAMNYQKMLMTMRKSES